MGDFIQRTKGGGVREDDLPQGFPIQLSLGERLRKSAFNGMKQGLVGSEQPVVDFVTVQDQAALVLDQSQ